MATTKRRLFADAASTSPRGERKKCRKPRAARRWAMLFLPLLSLFSALSPLAGAEESGSGDAQKRAGLSIQIMSYLPEGPDHFIVRDGAVQPAYTSNSKNPSPPAPSADHTSWLTFSAPDEQALLSAVRGLTLRALPIADDGDDGDDDDSGSNIDAKTKSTAVTAHLKVSIKRSSSGAVSDASNIFSHVVDIAYLCSGTPGKFTIIGTVPYSPRGPESTAEEKLLIFTLRKECGPGRIHGFNVFTDAAAPADATANRKRASNVGPAANAGNNDEAAVTGAAIVNGDATSSFDALSPVPYRVGYAQDSLVLSVRGPEEQNSVPKRPFQLGFNVSQIKIGDTPSRGKGPVKVLAVALEGEAAGGGTLEAGDAVELRLVFDCIVSGTPTVTIEFIINAHEHLTSKMTFQKECHVGPLPGFDVLPGGMNVADHLVVKDGLATPSFAQGSPVAIVDATRATADFELIAAHPGLVLPLASVYVTARDFNVQNNNREADGKSKHPNWKYSRGGPVGKGSIFGAGGSILDHFAKQLFNQASDVSPFSTGKPTLLQHFFDGPGRNEDGEGGGRRRRQLWRPNNRASVRDDVTVEEAIPPPPPPPPSVRIIQLPGDAGRYRGFRQSKKYRSTILRASLSGTALTANAISSNTTETLSVTHDCLRSGSSIVTVHIEVEPSKAKEDVGVARAAGMSDTLSTFLESIFRDAKAPKKVAFSYVKECVVGSVPGLDVTMGVYSPIKKMNGYAVFRGRVVGPFQAASRQKVVVREAEKRSHFYLSLDTDDWTLDVQKIRVAVTHASSTMGNSADMGKSASISHDVHRIASPVAAVLSDRAGSRLSADAPHKAFRVVGSREHPGTKIIEVAYNCHVSGVARLALHLEMQPTLPNGKVEPTRALTVSWEKVCHVPAVRGLNVKMVQPSYAVVSDGVVQDQFVVGSHAARFGKKYERVTFLISMATSISASVKKGEAAEVEEEVAIPMARPRVASSNAVCAPSLTGELMTSLEDMDAKRAAAADAALEAVKKESSSNIVVASVEEDVMLLRSGASSVQKLVLDFNCEQFNGSSVVTVTLPIRPPVRTRGSGSSGTRPVKNMAEIGGIGGQEERVMATYSASDVSFSVTKRCGKRRPSGVFKTWISTPAGKFLVSMGALAAISMVAGVLFCPRHIVNLRARILRHNYKYQRVKLEDDPESSVSSVAGEGVEMAFAGKANEGASSPNSLLKRATKVAQQGV